MTKTTTMASTKMAINGEWTWGYGESYRRLRSGGGIPEVYVKRVMQAYETVGS